MVLRLQPICRQFVSAFSISDFRILGILLRGMPKKIKNFLKTKIISNLFVIQSALDAILGHYPDGSSVGAAIQFLQNSNSGIIASDVIRSFDDIINRNTILGETFNHFDYGCNENLKRYGSCMPAEYDLSLVTAPVYLISGDRDPIAPPKVW